MILKRGLAGFFQLLKENSIEFKDPVVFDVGANEGQFIDRFISHFHEIELHAFEPTKTEYSKLIHKYNSKANFHINNFALSSMPGVAALIEHGNSKLNFVVKESENTNFVSTIELVTGDSYISRHGIEKIDFLKIDTEGHDFEVLKGFESALNRGFIRMIQVEVGLCPENKRHASLESVKEFLELYNYRLFYVHEFAWMGKGERFMRRFDAIFIRLKSVQ